MNPLRAISASLNKEISEDRWASPYIFGVEGGSKYMNLLADDAALSGQWTLAAYNNYHNIRNPGSAIKYEINPNFWLMDYIDQLSCLVISKDDMGTSGGTLSGTQWRTRYGWFPITKRHVIGCAHALTWASGTWTLNTAQQIPTRIRWRGSDGETVDRIQLHQAVGSDTSYGLPLLDISVAVLDSDLPDTVYVPKIVPANKRYRWSATQINQSQTQLWVPHIDLIAFSQEWAENVPEKPDESHRAMVWLTNRAAHKNNMQYLVYPGDSGTPILTIINGEVMLYGIISAHSAYMPKDNIMSWETYLNRMIEQADDNAIAMGRMAQRTGYTVTVAPNPILA
jgi:hypothetical protein